LTNIRLKGFASQERLGYLRKRSAEKGETGGGGWRRSDFGARGFVNAHTGKDVGLGG